MDCFAAAIVILAIQNNLLYNTNIQGAYQANEELKNT